MPALVFASLLGKDPSLTSTTFESARTDLEQLLSQAFRQAQQRGIQDSDSSLFAACAFADEAVLASNWHGRGEWMRHPLQQIHFNTINAGEEFYQRLAVFYERLAVPEPQINQNAEDLQRDSQRTKGADSDDDEMIVPSPQVKDTIQESSIGFETSDSREEQAHQAELRETLELYLTCFSMGYKGRYFHTKDQGIVDRLFREGLTRLGLAEAPAQGAICPEVYEQTGLSGARRTGLSTGLIIGFFVGTAGIATLLYLAYFAHLSVFVSTWL
ncbi:MAG: hypothetical protein C1943_10900 [Halochromatium sp.]|nr:hypothetical protein [Halochromatium sp.]